MLRNEVEVEVTVNGSGFDNPSEIAITKGDDISDCKMSFPRGTKNKLLRTDLVRVYIGLNGLPDIPTFIGYFDSDGGFFQNAVQLYGQLYRLTKDYIPISILNNFDNYEISNAIYHILSGSVLSASPRILQRTSPQVFVPKDTSKDSAISRYDLIKALKDLAIDLTNPLTVQGYVFFELNTSIYFRKISNPFTEYPHVTLYYGDSLLDMEPATEGFRAINRQQVFGKDQVYAIYSNAQRILMDGLREGEPIRDGTILTDAAAHAIAKGSVLSSLFDGHGLMANSHLLLDATPGVTLIGIEDAPFGIDDTYILRELNISLTEKSLKVTGGLANPKDAIGDVLSSVLKLT